MNKLEGISQNATLFSDIKNKGLRHVQHDTTAASKQGIPTAPVKLRAEICKSLSQ
jgi:hypothetical protein